MAVTIALVVVAAASAVVGAVEQSKSRKLSASIAAQQNIAQQKAASQTSLSNLEVGEASDIAAIINGTIQAQGNMNAAAQAAAIQAQGQAQVASLNQQGNILFVLSGGLVIVALAAVVLKDKKT